MFCHFKKLLGWTQCKINILSSTSQVAYWLHSKLLSNHVYHACGFNRFGWLVYIYILRPWITTRSFSFDIMRNSFGDLFYFVLFKLFQSYLSTSLNIRWILTLKKKTQILFHLVIHILSHGSTQLTIHLELTVLYHRCLGGSVFERNGWSTNNRT